MNVFSTHARRERWALPPGGLSYIENGAAAFRIGSIYAHHGGHLFLGRVRWHHLLDGSAVVSYRGTDHISDLAPDFQIALGDHHNPMLQSMGAAASQFAGDRLVALLYVEFGIGVTVWALWLARQSEGFAGRQLCRTAVHTVAATTASADCTAPQLFDSFDLLR